ncbi:MAG TPA: Rossmann-like and DUF2520 domain-containing protein [Chloroflexia bacterium]|nr:Rossmann-like and DUF2520 domain-containing protein [Chloroflexia bacterium]
MTSGYDFAAVTPSTPSAGLPTVGFVGAGKGGQTLAAGLAHAGVRVVAVASRSRESAMRLAALAGVPASGVYSRAAEVPAAAQLTLLTVPDDAIAAAVEEICRAGGWHPGHGVVHCSGALPSSLLDCARAEGSPAASFHPLQAFAARPADVAAAAAQLRGIVYGLEGDALLMPALDRMVRLLGGWPLPLQAAIKPLYHAAAVIASNYAVTLVATGADLLARCGLEPDAAVRALLPLLAGTLTNLTTLGVPEALTGPLSRGDTGTVARHLDHLDAVAPEAATLYRSLGLVTLPIALHKNPAVAGQLAAARVLLTQLPGDPEPPE